MKVALVIALLIAVCAASSSSSTEGWATFSVGIGSTKFCRGSPVGPATPRAGTCGRPLFARVAGLCCWFCNAQLVVKHRPELLAGLNGGDKTHFDFPQCRSVAARIRSNKRSAAEAAAGNSLPISEKAAKLRSVNSSEEPWTVKPERNSLHCDCCVNKCTESNDMFKYCGCQIY